MNILEMRAAYPARFCPQTWYDDEAFAQRQLTGLLPPPARSMLTIGGLPGSDLPLVAAVVLVHAFLGAPDLPVWADYLWTADTDHQGQRVYVGGIANGRGFEIHRFIHLTTRFGVPLWA